MTPFNSRAIPRRPLRLLAGTVVAVGIVLLIVVVFVAIIRAATTSGGGISVSEITRLVGMTVTQAALTTILSLVVGIALAWSLNRLHFPGKGLLVGMFSSALVTPGLVVAFGLIAVWGRNGWINNLLEPVFGDTVLPPVFGLGGILAAHVILDGAFAARILLARLDSIPPDRLKLGRSLGLSPTERFRHLDWPALASSLPGLGAVIFLLAFTSFPVVLLLGGGPANQTLEVAIYASVRLDFDLLSAAVLALVQMAICSLLILTSTAFSPVPAIVAGVRSTVWDEGRPTLALATAILVAGSVCFALPLLAVFVDGMGPGIGSLLGQNSFWRATGTSLLVATASTILALVLALCLGMARSSTSRALPRIALSAPAFAYLAVPAVVLSFGLFIAIRDAGFAPAYVAPFVIVVANAMLALPFAVATLSPPLDAITRTRGRLIRSLGLPGRVQFMLIEWPLLGRDIGVVLAIGFCFSLGDLGVIALFGTQDFTTLPLLMYRALGAYRSNDAASIAAIMLLLSVVAFTALPRMTGWLANARA